MDISVTKSDLSRALALTESIVQRKTTMPILVNLLLSAGNGKLQISATDLEITAVASVPAEIHAPGSTTVNAKVFCDVIRELPESELALKVTEGERIEIVSKSQTKSSQFKIVGISAQEFPSLPGIGLKTVNTVSARQFEEMINKTAYAVSQDETRFNLTGVCFELSAEGKGKKETKNLKLVATDGHRLAMISRPISTLDFSGSVIVPKKGLAEVKKVLDSNIDAEVGIGLIEGFLVVEGREAKISVRLIDGEFPDYNQVVPKEKGIAAVAPSADLAQALRRVALMVTDKEKCVKLDFSEGLLRVSSSSSELGEAKEELPVGYDGKPLTVGFNARYVLDMINSLQEGQNLVIELSGDSGPARFFAENDESYIGIIMPMRLT